MENLVVKSIDLFGDSVVAAQDNNGVVWAGIRWLCQGLGFSEGQMKWQIANIQKDLILSRGGANLLLNISTGEKEVFCLKIDFIPIWN